MLLALLLAQAAPVVPSVSWVDHLINQGPAGVVSAFLLYISYTLWNDNKAKQKQIDDLQAQRIDDAKAVTEKMLALAEKVHETTDELVRVADKLEK